MYTFTSFIYSWGSCRGCGCGQCCGCDRCHSQNCGRSQSHSSSRRDIVTKPKLLLQMYFSPSFVSDAKLPKPSANFFRAKCRFAYSSSCSVTWLYTSMLSWNNYAENIFVSFDITSLENSINVQLTIFKNFVLTIFCSAVIWD